MQGKRERYNIRAKYVGVYTYEELQHIQLPYRSFTDIVTGKVINDVSLQDIEGDFYVDSAVIARLVSDGFDFQIGLNDIKKLYKETLKILGKNEVSTVRNYLGDDVLDDNTKFLNNIENYKALKSYIEEKFEHVIFTDIKREMETHTLAGDVFGLNKPVFVKKEIKKESEPNTDYSQYYQ